MPKDKVEIELEDALEYIFNKTRVDVKIRADRVEIDVQDLEDIGDTSQWTRKASSQRGLTRLEQFIVSCQKLMAVDPTV